VVTDLHMPGLSGLDLIETARFWGSPVPMILLTASLEDAARHADRLDFGLVPKPVKPQALAPAVRRALGDRSVAQLPSVSRP
jgi:CheY-like chemotaxis protein